MADDALKLRKMTFEGIPYDDDWLVVWRDIPVGRILKQSGTPVGKPNWFWGVNLPGQPQQAGHRGICSDIEECKRRFKVAWSGVKASLTESNIEKIRQKLNEPAPRTKWPGKNR